MGMGMGILLFLIAFPLLFWNEGRAVQTYQALVEGAGAVVSVAADKVDAANEGKLIHLSGLATTDEKLSDPDFGISANALILNRNVEMYQWTEEKSTKTTKNLGGSTTDETTYSYQKEWSSSLIASDNFKESSGHENPSSMLYNANQWVAKNATVGAFKLPENIVTSINNSESLAVTSEAKIPAALMGKAQIINSLFYLGQNPQSPNVGDMRISFTMVKPTQISLVYQQMGDSFTPYTTSNGNTIELLETGNLTAPEMFASAQTSNTIMTWILRVVGFFLMFFGVSLILNPISVFFDFIPFLGGLTGFALQVVTFLVAAPLALFVIALAWIVYRPLLAIGLIIFGLLCLGAAIFAAMQFKRSRA
jgi:hypothetical protein